MTVSRVFLLRVLCRTGHSCAKERGPSSSNVYVYGGEGYGETTSPSGAAPYLADLWKYDIVADIWSVVDEGSKEPGLDEASFSGATSPPSSLEGNNFDYTSLNNLRASARAYYSFESGGPTDDNGNHDGTLSADAPVLVDGRFGSSSKAYQFDQDDYEYILLDSSVAAGSALSVCAWFRRDGPFDTGLNYLVGGGDGAVYLAINGHNLQFGGRGNQPHAGLRITSFQILDNDWHLFCGTYDGSAIRLYYESVFQGQKTASGSYSGLVAIGSSKNTNEGRVFDGTIDEVLIFDFALSQAQIDEIYNEPAPTSATRPGGLKWSRIWLDWANNLWLFGGSGKDFIQ